MRWLWRLLLALARVLRLVVVRLVHEIRTRTNARDRGKPEQSDAGAAERLERAGRLLRARRYAEALAEYDWLWDHLHLELPAMAGVRLSFMAAEMGQLAQQHRPARRRFQQLRDRAGAAAGADDDPDPAALEARFEWMVLNEVIAETDHTVAWFDRVGDLRRLGANVPIRHGYRLIPLLRQRHRWADLGRLHVDPLQRLREQQRMKEVSLAHVRQSTRPPATRAQEIAVFEQMYRDYAAMLYRSLRAAGRAEEARAIHTEALRTDGDARMRQALDQAAADQAGN